MTKDETIRAVEAILFASPHPVQLPEIQGVLGKDVVSKEALEEMVASLTEEHGARNGGFELAFDPALGYQFRTVSSVQDLMEAYFSSRPKPLSKSAQETLAIVAYRQPVTRADIEFIRGVDAGSILKSLLERELIKCVGRKEDAGRPMLFGTTPEFLSVYGLKSLDDLPPLQAFQSTAGKVHQALDDLDGDQDEAAQMVDEIVKAEQDKKHEGTYRI